MQARFFSPERVSWWLICGCWMGLALGCATAPLTKKTTSSVPPEVVFVDQALSQVLQAGPVASSLSSHKLLSVQLPMNNRGSQDLSLQAQTWYQDAQGEYLQSPEVREGAWTSFYLPGGQATVYRSQSLGPGAEKFVIRIRVNPVGTLAPAQPILRPGEVPPPPGLFN